MDFIELETKTGDMAHETKIDEASSAFDSLPSDLDAIIHVLEIEEPKFPAVDGIKTEPPYSDADMVSADITYLKHLCSGPEFIRLMAYYIRDLKPSFEEMVLAGRTSLFLEHADAEYATVGSTNCAVPKCLICRAWGLHHHPRVEMRAAAEAQLAKLHDDIREEEAKGMYRNCMTRSKSWQCARAIVTMFPEQLRYAVQICADNNVDPTALGPICKVLELSETMSQEDSWEKLLSIYRECGLGLWPGISKKFSIQTAEQSHYRQSDADI